MSRIGRSQPVQPFAGHGFDDSLPSGDAQPAIQVVPLDTDRHHTRPSLPAVVATHGFVDSGVGVPGTTPPEPVSVDRADQRVRYLPLPAVVLNPALLAVQPPPAGQPPAPFNVDRVDQRGRFRPLDPNILSGILAGFVQAPAATPPGPFVVPLEERKRFLERLQPEVRRGFDDPAAPDPTVVEPDDRRRRIRPPGDPLVVSGALAAFFVAPAVLPPRPLTVFSDERLLRRTLQPIVLLGPFFNLITPPIVTGTFQNNPAGQTGSTPDELELASGPAGQTGSTPSEGAFGTNPGGQ